MTFPRWNRLSVMFLAAVLCSFLVVSASPAQKRVTWPSGRPLAPYSAPQLQNSTLSPQLQVRGLDTLRVLAVMVEFQEDEETQTVGTGKFDMTSYAGRAIDPPPHDRFFFQSKITFVQNYFAKVSNGKLTVEGEVLPSIVTVSGKMSDYSQDDEPEFRGLARLAIEAWTIADTQFPSVDIAAYDAYVLFHAGTGKDIDLVSLYGYDPAPYDIPSIYLSLQGFKEALDSTAFNGISVRSGSHLITNTMILPETESRFTGNELEGDTVMISFNGLFAASIGSHLGLPDLFETGSGTSAIGQNGLMDGASIFAYFGLFPPEPSAWERVYLGWAEPIVVNAPLSTLTAPAIGLTSDVDTIYKVPMNSSEYYLVENRNRDPHGNGQRLTVVRNGVSSILTFPKDSSFYFSFDNVSAINGSVTDVEDFDWALIGFMFEETAYTGGGILIWHIDENIVQAGLPSNSINADIEHRGVDLEEADGAQDIGRAYDAYTGGSGAELGSPLDCWYDGNLSLTYTNTFGASSYPNSNANSGARSLVTIRDFSVRSPRMTFTVEYGASDISSLPGFPKQLHALATAAVTYDVDNDGVSELFTSAIQMPGTPNYSPLAPSKVHGWTAGGVSILDPSDSTGIIAQVGESLISAPVLFSVTSQPMIAAATLGRVYVWALSDGDGDGLADSVLVKDVPIGMNIWRLAAVDSFLVAYGQDGISVFSITGRQVFSDTEPHSVAATGDGAVIARGRGASLRITDLNGILSETQRDLGDPIQAMASGNAANGGRLLAVLTGPAASPSKVHLFELAGTTLGQHSDRELSGSLASGESYDGSLVLADVDADTKTDLVLSTSQGRIFAFNLAGVLLENYPVRTSGGRGASPLLLRSSSGRGADLFRFDTSGSLYQSIDGVRLGIQLGDPGLPSAALGRVNDGSLSVLALFSVQSTGRVGGWKYGRSVNVSDLLWPVATGTPSGSYASVATTVNPVQIGSGLLPADRTYNWPNPVYGHETRIRYFSDQDGTVTVDIFDLAGDKITQLTGTAMAGQDGEVIWDVTGIQSGVYIARIEIAAGGRTAERRIKIAVIK